MARSKEIELGFVEKVDSTKLHSCYFPSKVGGKPAWLALDHLPDNLALQCKQCGDPCLFLLQVYAPLDEKDSAFHRIIFVFICKNPKCCSKNNSQNIVVFRSQIPRDNKYFSKEPPSEDSYKYAKKGEDYQDLCLVCGCIGNKKCSKCHTASYCSRSHQVLHWKGSHKAVCGSESASSTFETGDYLFPEYELVTEPEEYEVGAVDKTDEKKMEEYTEFLKSEKAESLMAGDGSDLVKDLNQMAAKETTADKVFKKFKKRIDHEPEQVLRYQQQGEALWVSSESQPTDSDIPKCSCGSHRRFEFQILPQLLNHLKVDKLDTSLDWGTLVVYTCAASCDGECYKQEFVWKQDFSE